jgi:hypothetical protein
MSPLSHGGKAQKAFEDEFAERLHSDFMTKARRNKIFGQMLGMMMGLSEQATNAYISGIQDVFTDSHDNDGALVDMAIFDLRQAGIAETREVISAKLFEANEIALGLR